MPTCSHFGPTVVSLEYTLARPKASSPHRTISNVTVAGCSSPGHHSVTPRIFLVPSYQHSTRNSWGFASSLLPGVGVTKCPPITGRDAADAAPPSSDLLRQ